MNITGVIGKIMETGKNDKNNYCNANKVEFPESYNYEYKFIYNK